MSRQERFDSIPIPRIDMNILAFSRKALEAHELNDNIESDGAWVWLRFPFGEFDGAEDAGVDEGAESGGVGDQGGVFAGEDATAEALVFGRGFVAVGVAPEVLVRVSGLQK